MRQKSCIRTRIGVHLVGEASGAGTTIARAGMEGGAPRRQARRLDRFGRCVLGMRAQARRDPREAGEGNPEAGRGEAMRFEGRVKKEGRFWLVEIPAFDAWT